MPLYLKLYLYFITLIVILFLLLPVIVIRSIGKHGEMKPPHVRLIETIHKTVAHVEQSTYGNDILAGELEKMVDRKDIQVALYDRNGKALVWTGRHDDLGEGVLLKLQRDNFFSDDPGPGRAMQMVIPVNSPRFAYLSVVDNMMKHDFHPGRFIRPLIGHHFPPGLIDRLLIMCLVSFVLIYPLALHFTRPLERITRKAIRFTAGDFGDIGKSLPMKGNDEISRLDRAFDHMARGFVSMIESKKELISDISHELGSPLSRMQVAVDIMEEQREKGEQPSTRTLGILSRNIDEMSKIVKELLDLSRANKTIS